MSERNARGPRSLKRIFAAPFVLGVLSTVGLIGALVGDNLWDVLGWIGLGVPLAVTLWCLARRSAA